VRLVVGLGNPGSEYAATRHNAGFLAVDELHRRLGGGPWQKKFRGEICDLRDATLGDDGRLLLVKPQTYMNLAGECVGPAATYFKVAVADIIVVHDELDLPLGTLRLKVGGGHGGHNGLRSLHQHVGADFVRIRLGVGRPEGKGEAVVGHVLGSFRAAEKESFSATVDAAADAVMEILRQGTAAAMNRHNRRPKPQKDPGPEKT
jgi:PTH1 family peptidyl-tRNA hydrolase